MIPNVICGHLVVCKIFIIKFNLRIYEMAALKVPFEGKDISFLHANICKG